jgi:hypothetical protein
MSAGAEFISFDRFKKLEACNQKSVKAGVSPGISLNCGQMFNVSQSSPIYPGPLEHRKSPPDGLRDIARGEVGIVLLGHPGVGA